MREVLQKMAEKYRKGLFKRGIACWYFTQNMAKISPAHNKTANN